MENVMCLAWQIARKAANRFGGKKKDYFQQALVQAWKEFKGGYEVVCNYRNELSILAANNIFTLIEEHQQDAYNRYGTVPNYAKIYAFGKESRWMKHETAVRSVGILREWFLDGQVQFEKTVSKFIYLSDTNIKTRGELL